jgi:hypothetical protein
MKPPRLPLRTPLCIIATFLLAGCESRPDRHAMVEEARHSVPPMAANEAFFDGAVIAHLTLGSDAGAGGGPGDDSSGGSGHGSGGMSGGMGGRHGGGHGGGMGGGGTRQGGDSSGGDGASPSSMHRSNMPPAMLRLRLENTTAVAVEVEVRGLDSELGDFAVRPDKLTIAPGRSEEPDPMESLLGVDTYSLPVTVTLRYAGRTETKVLTLQLLKPAPDVSGAPPNRGS